MRYAWTAIPDSTASIMCITPATRPVSSTAQPLYCSPPGPTYGRTASTPRGRIRATAAVGSEPIIMLTAPGPAAQRCLAKAGMGAADIDLWEINEAFAAVVLKAIGTWK